MLIQVATPEDPFRAPQAFHESRAVNAHADGGSQAQSKWKVSNVANPPASPVHVRTQWQDVWHDSRVGRLDSTSWPMAVLVTTVPVHDIQGP